ncbi:TetR/AcrR family transcriptional regulator C-terminal domain-containing protein [Niameybacter massiliensis]|uniref:TetR/AcrR family transcriptional regulator C-terminal domain-containing protein n=1 Tax=Holtiella tumoricola TaxID=3018743 RepID=A0AA42DJZ0_9FIRM|nr:TetR/AcrR family transcriptional regulator C-terminal domain-containing protein [Holtiella tumoricola]MDA3730270.1 TetR/AcrR family transcriptional regulator C-terminal domain-containing protein [Holtiella tumoricola]
MAGIKGNRRIIYTKTVIKESLIELLQDKEIHQITVTDICKKADINRGTFYSHYKDAYDLLQSMEDELFNQILEYVLEMPLETHLNTLLISIFELIAENQSLCKILFCNQRGSQLLDRILYIAHKADIESLVQSPELDGVFLDYLIKYSIGGILSVIQVWLQNGLKESPADLVKFLSNMSTYTYYPQN